MIVSSIATYLNVNIKALQVEASLVLLFRRKKPVVSNDDLEPSTSETNDNGKASKIPSCSTDNDFARSFSKWLQNSCGGGKSPKQSDIIVVRALKFLKFCRDEIGDSEEEVFVAPNVIDYSLGSPELLTKFIDNLEKEWGIGQSGCIAYVSSIADLIDFRKFHLPSATTLQNFSVAEVYVKRAREFLAKGTRTNWRKNLDI